MYFSARPITVPRYNTTFSSLLSSARVRNLLITNTSTDPIGKSRSSSPKARTTPKVYNSNIRGSGLNAANQLTDEQQKEVDEHNSSFAKKQCSSKREREDDKFWKGR
jgi:hypothetical protein